MQRRVAKLYLLELNKLNVSEVAAAEKEKIKGILQNLTIDNKFSPNKFWELCKKARSKSSCGTSVETEEGVELFGDELILNAYLDEFVHRLRKRDIIPELRNY